MKLWNFYLHQLFRWSPATTGQLVLRSFWYSVVFVTILQLLHENQLHEIVILYLGISFIVFLLVNLLIRVTKNYLDAGTAYGTQQEILEQYKLRQRTYRAIRKDLEEAL